MTILILSILLAMTVPFALKAYHTHKCKKGEHGKLYEYEGATCCGHCNKHIE